MKFEYDSNKTYTNEQKRGICFEDAQLLWQDENILEVSLSFPDEARHLCIGKIGYKHYSAVITYREEILHYENS